MPIHLRANKEDYAPCTLLVGDPARAVRISQMLTDSKMVNKHRGLLGYTGQYRIRGLVFKPRVWDALQRRS